MNSLFNQLNNNAPSLLSSLLSAKNPQQMVMQLAKTNPQVANVLQEVKNNGGDAKTLFYKKAQQMGVDPNTILKQIK